MTFIPYKRRMAVHYAYQYALTPNTTKWKSYEKYGGDCTNFVSQCLYAGSMPFDTVGKSVLEKWYWYSDFNRTPTWTAANAFKNYLLNSARRKEGIQSLLISKDELMLGDIVQLGDLEETRHSMLVTGFIRSQRPPYEIIDYMIAQNSTDEEGRGYDIPLSIKPIDQIYFHIEGFQSE